jgi:GntR family transcriptional repressor for pyruvate dehydrogenase complex
VTADDKPRKSRAEASALDGRHSSERVSAIPLRRVRKSYEQAADQLRELIVSGRLAQGERLPTESALSREFGVSRGTVREALRLVAAQGLIRTTKGAGGGSYVTMPTVHHISESLSSNIALLADARDLTLEELIEVRMLLEVPAARFAARRRTIEDIQLLRGAIPSDDPPLDTQSEFVHNRDFHATLIECCGNALLRIAAQPVFSALQTSLSRSGLGRSFHTAIHAHHGRIVEAVHAADEDCAAREMHDHLEFLVPYYEKAWRRARRFGE